MTGERARAVDDYLAERLLGRDEALAEALKANAAAGLPAIDVSPLQGKFLELLVRITGARRVLELGTLGGYSTISMARALPSDGELVTLEYEQHHSDVAAANIAQAGVADKVRIVVGPAAETLRNLAGEGTEPFDLVFIDADKPNNRTYLEWAVELSRPGTVIILDNVVRSGQVIEAGSTDASIVGTRDAFDFIANHPRLSATALQTVGAKGWDGFAMMVVS